MFFFVESIHGESGEEKRVISFFCGEKNLNKNKGFFLTLIHFFFSSPFYIIRGMFFFCKLRRNKNIFLENMIFFLLGDNRL